MPRRSTLRLTKRLVDGLKVEEKDAIFWDRDLAGFGVRVHATERKLYVVQSRGPPGLKRVTLGPCAGIDIEERRGDGRRQRSSTASSGAKIQGRRNRHPSPRSPTWRPGVCPSNSESSASRQRSRSVKTASLDTETYQGLPLPRRGTYERARYPRARSRRYKPYNHQGRDRDLWARNAAALIGTLWLPISLR